MKPEENIEGNLNITLREIATLKPASVSCQDAIHLLDLTLLDEHASDANINALAVKANQHEVAAICILPHQLARIATLIQVKRATVVNFPSGNQPHEQVLASIQQLINENNTDEIDYVFPYQSYLSGQREFALSCCQQNYHLCRKHNITFKVILETGVFPSLAMIYQASVDVINHGCDFLKTSTGKLAIGASIPAAFSILSAIKDTGISCGIKVSGGVKTTDQAFSYIHLAQHVLQRKIDNSWFRLGASSLLDDLLS